MAIMTWISKNPPIYAWHGDFWYNEKNKITFKCDTIARKWGSDTKDIYFPKYTIIMDIFNLQRKNGNKLLFKK